MQLMPATAKRTAKRFGLRLRHRPADRDPAYNARLGSAHLGELMEDWRGSLHPRLRLLQRRRRQREEMDRRLWRSAQGRRSMSVDWVERIPFTETRNYVQRVMENLQVYRNRLGGDRSALLSESDLRRSAVVQ